LTKDASFEPNAAGLSRALELLTGAEQAASGVRAPLPATLPEWGIGEVATLEGLAPHVLGAAARLGAPDAFAHMDPPTPWLTWALTFWNASLNQNLLHPSTAPFGRDAERLVVQWLAPAFGMEGGHMTPGSTVANITALWAARDAVGARRVVASSAAHLSVRKAAHLLGMCFEEVPVDSSQRMDGRALPDDLSDACLVLTAGTTAAGALDPLDLCGRAAWTHLDAAWAGPLRLSSAQAARLDGLERADSVSISAHKWLFQPKESALVLFRDAARAEATLSFAGGYLAVPNVGVLGSHGAAAVPLLGLLLAWGREGLAVRIDRCMDMAARLAKAVEESEAYDLFGPPDTGVVLFRPKPGIGAHNHLSQCTVSQVAIAGAPWLRCVAANPGADIEAIAAQIATMAT
jgi:L-2,4-diaminobutyrate decarboxylase